MTVQANICLKRRARSANSACIGQPTFAQVAPSLPLVSYLVIPDMTRWDLLHEFII